MKGTVAVATAAAAAGLALAACGGSSPPKPALVTRWLIDGYGRAVIQYTAPGTHGLQANFVSPYDGSTVPSQVNEPAHVSSYRPVCVVKIPSARITWRVYDLATGQTIGGGAQADCFALGDAPSLPGEIKSGPAFR
jgi:hypothetical protein